MDCDVNVVLTTSSTLKLILPPHEMNPIIENKKEEFTDLMSINFPVCLAKQQIEIISGDPNLAVECLTEPIKDLAEIVAIDHRMRTVYVGKNNPNYDSGLIIYSDDRPLNIVRNFFQRWRETEELFLEYQILNDDNFLFCLRGYWLRTKWESLDTYTTTAIIHNPKLSDVVDTRYN